MKTKLSVTTVVEISGVEVSWAINEALTKAFKDVAHVNDELTDDDAQGYSFTFVGNQTIDLKALESKVKKIIDTAHAKELAEYAEKEAKAKKNMEWFDGFKLTPVKNSYAKMMDEVIESFSERILKYIDEKDFCMAEGSWNDAQDMITLRMLLDTKGVMECYKFARILDSLVREAIPEKVYDFLVHGEE